MESVRVIGERNVLRWEGDYWTIVFDRKTIRLRDSKGLRYLAALLRRPGEQIHALDLQAAADPGSSRPPRAGRSARSPEQARLAVTKGIKAALERIRIVHPALGAHLEATVHRGYLCRYLPDPRRPISWDE
jgi:hypothetical protein